MSTIPHDVHLLFFQTHQLLRDARSRNLESSQDLPLDDAIDILKRPGQRRSITHIGPFGFLKWWIPPQKNEVSMLIHDRYLFDASWGTPRTTQHGNIFGIFWYIMFDR